MGMWVTIHQYLSGSFSNSLHYCLLAFLYLLLIISCFVFNEWVWNLDIPWEFDHNLCGNGGLSVYELCMNIKGQFWLWKSDCCFTCVCDVFYWLPSLAMSYSLCFKCTLPFSCAGNCVALSFYCSDGFVC